MSLDQLHKQMKWPNRKTILSPPGVGPRLLAELARDKIEGTIRRFLEGASDVHVGILTKNPDSENTDAPLAVVCEFARCIGRDTGTMPQVGVELCSLALACHC